MMRKRYLVHNGERVNILMHKKNLAAFVFSDGDG